MVISLPAQHNPPIATALAIPTSIADGAFLFDNNLTVFYCPSSGASWSGFSQGLLLPFFKGII